MTIEVTPITNAGIHKALIRPEGPGPSRVPDQKKLWTKIGKVSAVATMATPVAASVSVSGRGLTSGRGGTASDSELLVLF